MFIILCIYPLKQVGRYFCFNLFFARGDLQSPTQIASLCAWAALLIGVIDSCWQSHELHFVLNFAEVIRKGMAGRREYIGFQSTYSPLFGRGSWVRHFQYQDSTLAVCSWQGCETCTSPSALCRNQHRSDDTQSLCCNLTTPEIIRQFMLNDVVTQLRSPDFVLK